MHRSVLYVDPKSFDMSTLLPNRALLKHVKQPIRTLGVLEKSGVDAQFFLNVPPRKRSVGAGTHHPRSCAPFATKRPRSFTTAAYPTSAGCRRVT